MSLKVTAYRKPRKLKTLQGCGTRSSYRAYGSQKGQFYQGMTKFLVLWKPWKGTRQLQPQAAAVATIVSLPIILRHTQKSYNAPRTPLPTEEFLSSWKMSTICLNKKCWALLRCFWKCRPVGKVSELQGRSSLCCQFGVITPLKPFHTQKRGVLGTWTECKTRCGS